MREDSEGEEVLGRWMRGVSGGRREEKRTDNLEIIRSACGKWERTVGWGWGGQTKTQVCARRVFMKEQREKCDMLVDIHSSFPIWFQFISRRSL